jgi:hypothetical protein
VDVFRLPTRKTLSFYAVVIFLLFLPVSFNQRSLSQKKISVFVTISSWHCSRFLPCTCMCVCDDDDSLTYELTYRFHFIILSNCPASFALIFSSHWPPIPSSLFPFLSFHFIFRLEQNSAQEARERERVRERQLAAMKITPDQNSETHWISLEISSLLAYFLSRTSLRIHSLNCRMFVSKFFQQLFK